jgi:branched-chain amino acid transport system substrate-binding protein
MKKILLLVAGVCWLAAPLAVSRCSAAEDTQPIKIGAIFSVTGPASFLGAPESKTAQMLVDKINASGGVLGRKLELIIKDSGGKPENAVSFAKQLI